VLLILFSLPKVKIRIFFKNFRLQIPEKDSEGDEISRRLPSRVLGGRRGDLAVRCLEATGAVRAGGLFLSAGEIDSNTMRVGALAPLTMATAAALIFIASYRLPGGQARR
jgi:hypothetical protein